MVEFSLAYISLGLLYAYAAVATVRRQFIFESIPEVAGWATVIFVGALLWPLAFPISILVLALLAPKDEE